MKYLYHFAILPLLFFLLVAGLLRIHSPGLMSELLEVREHRMVFETAIPNTSFAELKKEMENDHESEVHLSWGNGLSLSMLPTWSWSSLTRSTTDSKLSNITKSFVDKIRRKNLAEIKDLEIQVEFGKRITDNGLLTLAEDLSNFRKLESLTFFLNKTRDITDEGMMSFIKTIGDKFKHLNNLSLNLYRSKYLTNSGLRALGSQLGASLSHLQNFTLNLENCGSIQDDGLQAFLEEVTPKLTQLRHLHLNLQKTPITEKGVKEIAGFIQRNLRNLESLHLNLQESKVSPNAVIALGQSFPFVSSVSIV